ncbi:MAG TPA: hypothetical protein VM598_14370 [Bdellovibrionota bacterium]|nr:hypothetical protein [Bdellovibrionota bacterium]
MRGFRPALPLVLLALVFLAHGATLHHPFHFDDGNFVVSNSAIHTPANLMKIWTSSTYTSTLPENRAYRPLTTFVHSLAWIAGGGAPWPFHLLKLLLHAGVCLLLFGVWKRIWNIPGFFPVPGPRLRFRWRGRELDLELTAGRAAAGLALVFAIHPANSEIVNYISADTTLLAGFFYLGAYYLYMRFREATRGGAYLLGSLVLYGLSMLAKEEGITLVAVIALTELLLPWPWPPADRKKAGKAVAAYALIAALGGLLIWRMLSGLPDGSGGLGRWPYFMTQWRAYIHYMKLLFWPWALNADNLEFGFSASIRETQVLSALVANGLLLVWAWLMRRRYPVLLFCLLWFYVAVSPTSSIVVLAEPVNDRRMYIAYFGLVGAAFPFALRLLQSLCEAAGAQPRGLASGPAAALAFVALLAGTEARNHTWSSYERLWLDTVEKNPHSGRAINNLLVHYMGQGDWDRSRDLLDRCEALAPNYSPCKTNRAVVLVATGRDAEADEAFRRAIAVDPSPSGKFSYAEYLERRDRLGEALQLYREIDMATAETNLDAKLGWARLVEKLGHPVEAKAIRDAARAKFGDHPRIPR